MAWLCRAMGLVSGIIVTSSRAILYALWLGGALAMRSLSIDAYMSDSGCHIFCPRGLDTVRIKLHVAIASCSMASPCIHCLIVNSHTSHLYFAKSCPNSLSIYFFLFLYYLYIYIYVAEIPASPHIHKQFCAQAQSSRSFHRSVNRR